MYRIEIITTVGREVVIKSETAETWEEANDIIDDFQDFQLKNIKIEVTRGEDPIEYLGDFTNIKRGELLNTPNKKKNNNLIVGLAGLVMFPIMVINRLVKK